MIEIASSRRRRRTIVVAIGAVVVAALIGVGAYGFVRNPTETARSTGQPGAAAPRVTSPVPARRTVPATADPQEFAREIALALFAWDTSRGSQPADYVQTLVDVGDPSGQENSGLAADLITYYPTGQEWNVLRGYQTRQWLTVTSLTIPRSWPTALEEAKGTLRPGTSAYTIAGTRHRTGVWAGKPVATAGPVSFTMFETCTPTFPTCRLLRLSQPDTPLP